MALNATKPLAQELLVHARERGANVAGVPSPTWRHDEQECRSAYCIKLR